jgi:hypothetical protein
MMGRAWTGLIWLRIGKVLACCQHGNQPSSSTQCVSVYHSSFIRKTHYCRSYSVGLQMAPPARRLNCQGALWCHLPTTFQAASRRAPTCHLCSSHGSLPSDIGQTARTVNEHGLGQVTLGEFNQRYQCWANPRRDFILIELRPNITPLVQEELSLTLFPSATHRLVLAPYRSSYDIYRVCRQHIDF